MTMRTIIIKISNDRVFFNPEFSIPFSQTDFPEDALTFKGQVDIFWLVEMVKFDSSNRKLFVKVLDYNEKNIDTFNIQKPKMEIRHLSFLDGLDWNKLEPQLSYYSKIELLPILKELPVDERPAKAGPKSNDFISTKSSDNYKREVKVDFSIGFADIHFKLGYVSFKKHIQEVFQEVDFKILNEFLLPEFDVIKFWFSKKLGTRKIKVKANIILTYGVVANVHAKSEQIGAITQELIELIKQQRTLGLTKKPNFIQPDKSLFTSEDIFDQLDDGSAIQGNVFKQSEKDILELLLADKNIRNRQQLVYLSGAKQSDKEKIRFTLASYFGFLFFIEGERANHFVWELLNSHATYVWTIGKKDLEIRLQYLRVEQSINTIRSSGRDRYKNAYRAHNMDSDLVFSLLKHTHSGSKLGDGFPIWKHRLNELLI